RRLNPVAGRSLTDTALQTEQTQHSTRLALLGRLLAPGVVSGLEIVLEPPTGANVPPVVRVQPGLGRAASGEVVTATWPIRGAVAGRRGRGGRGGARGRPAPAEPARPRRRAAPRPDRRRVRPAARGGARPAAGLGRGDRPARHDRRLPGRRLSRRLRRLAVR